MHVPMVAREEILHLQTSVQVVNPGVLTACSAGDTMHKGVPASPIMSLAPCKPYCRNPGQLVFVGKQARHRSCVFVLQMDQILFIWVHTSVCLMQQAKAFLLLRMQWGKIMSKSRTWGWRGADALAERMGNPTAPCAFRTWDLSHTSSITCGWL